MQIIKMQGSWKPMSAFLARFLTTPILLFSEQNHMKELYSVVNSFHGVEFIVSRGNHSNRYYA